MNTQRPIPTDLSFSEVAAGEELAILYSDISMAVFPDLVCPRGAEVGGGWATSRARVPNAPGLEYAIMHRHPGGPWQEVGTGRTARQVLAERWHIRIDAGGW